MDLMIWIPGMMILGLATLGLLFSFIVVCDKL